MPVLSAANQIQAKTGSKAFATTADVSLDNPTTPGGTVVVEVWGPIVWPGMPAGWDFDVQAASGLLWVFRDSGTPGGETTWTWSSAGNDWLWRVTEWDVMLDPVSPLEAVAVNTASGASVATFSTTTSPTTNRAEVVALASFAWSLGAGAPTRTMDFSGYTNGFTERDELRASFTAHEMDVAWAWAFASATGTFETTATVTTNAPSASDTFYSTLAVYAATQPVVTTPGAITVV